MNDNIDFRDISQNIEDVEDGLFRQVDNFEFVLEKYLNSFLRWKAILDNRTRHANMNDFLVK